MLELRICGGVEVEADGRPLPESLIGGRQGRLVLAYLVCERDRAVRREELAELLWADELPESWTASLSAVISRLRRLFTEAGLDGTSAIASSPGSYQLELPADSRIDLEDLFAAVAEAEEAAAAGETDRALVAAERAEAVAARGFLVDDCEWVDARRDEVRDVRVRASIARSAAHLGAGASGRAIDAARHALELDDSKEAAYRQLMLALTAAGERAEALRVWERCRATLVEELGVDPSPETEAVYLSLLEVNQTAAVTTQLPSGVVTFLLTDIVESSALWEEHAAAMAAALERHDAVIGRIVAAHGGTLLKSKLEGDATVSVFARATEGAAAALALLDAMESEPWSEGTRPRVRMAMHTGEAFERGGDYFGPALNRAARLRGLAAANEVLLSQAVAELVRDQLPSGASLRDRGLQSLRGLSRGENVFELTRAAAGREEAAPQSVAGEDLERPAVPAALVATGPFVGRGDEVARLDDLWERAAAGEAGAVLVGGEPGVGKSRLASEIAHHAFDAGALVLYGRCDEDLAAPLQPFIEAVRTLAPALGATRLRAVRGVDELTRVVPDLADLLEAHPATRADPDTERLALFDAVSQLLAAASREVPVLLVLDDLHWAGKTTLSLLRHVLRGAKGSRLLVLGTYRDTELARTHPLAETLADLRRDSDTHRLTLGGLAPNDVVAYLAAIGNSDRALGRELAEVTAGNPFFLIEVVRHVEESGGSWQPGSLPEGVREATGRRLSRLSDAANDALAVAAVVGATFDLALVEQVRGVELVDPIGEAVRAGLVLEEPGSLARFRFAHAIVRQVLLSELVSLKRVRLHRTIAELLEAAPPAADPDARLADLAYHWFECASAGSADRAVSACRQAADRAMERLAYEEAGDLYGMALQAFEWVEPADPEIVAPLHLARCDALLTAGDVAGARDALDALELAAVGSERLAAWYTTYEGLLAVLGEPDRLHEIVQSIGAAAGAMRDVGDLTGEAKARYVHAAALERLGQIGAAERALDAALAAARSADDRRLADAILAEAPPAALWGPSPVMRASGRCLDVVRVLRITSGTPAVEAVALRCQAVLEALRGRMEAARRMVASSRRTVEQLGLTHRLLEAELAAGQIELLDGQAAAAEEHLRAAYDGLRERGLGGEAAQAGAFLGRALLLQDRVDDADEVAAEAEALAGSDLKAAITWRDVRALAAARRGNIDRALSLAWEAVELAGATDALVLVADARLTLAAVLRAAGDVVAADAEARRAVEACEAKGATTLAAVARAAMRDPEPASAVTAAPLAARSAGQLTTNLAMASAVRLQEAFNRGDWDAVRANRRGLHWVDDRRPVVGMTMTADDGRIAQTVHAGGGRFEPPELLATRGDRLALYRSLLRHEGMEVPFLAITRVDRDGLMDEYVMFEPESMDDALAALDQMASEGAFQNEATRMAARHQAAYLAHDWDAVLACLSDDVTNDDRRSLMHISSDHEEAIAGARWFFEVRGQFERSVIATRGRSWCLERWTIRIPDPEAHDTLLVLMGVDESGRSQHTAMFDTDDLDGALAELDRLYLEGEGPERAQVIGLGSSFIAALDRHDLVTVRRLLAPDGVVRSHRDVVRSPDAHGADAWLATLQPAIDLAGRGRVRIDHVTDVSDAGGLWVLTLSGDDADGGMFAVVYLLALRIADGRVTAIDVFGEQQADAARAALDARQSPTVERFGNDATRAQQAMEAALNGNDWSAVLARVADGYQFDDRRPVVGGMLSHEQSVASLRLLFDGGGAFSYETVATRSRTLALARTSLWVPDLDAGATVLNITRVDDAGRHVQTVAFDGDDVENAFAELDRMYLEGEGAEHAEVIGVVTSFLGAAQLEDLSVVRDLLSDDFVARSYGDWLPDLVGAGDYLDALRDALEVYGRGASRIDHVTDVYAEGGIWALTFRGEAADRAPIEIPFLLAVHVADGRISGIDIFDEHDVDAARAVLAPARDDVDRSAAQDWFANDAARTSLRSHQAFNAHDWNAFTACYSDTWAQDDRRSVVSMPLDHEQSVIGMQFVFDGGGTFEDRETLATRGRRLVLRRTTLRIPDPEATYPVLVITGVDDLGLVVHSTLFDAYDLDGAFAELDRLFLEGEGAEHAEVIATVKAFLDALGTRDTGAVNAVLGPGFAVRSHRMFRPSDELTASEWIRTLDEQFDTAQQSVAAGTSTLRVDHVRLFGAGGLWAVTWEGELEDGGSFALPWLFVIRVADGRVTRVDAYDEDDAATALAALDARFAEHVEEARGNAASRAARRACDVLNRRDWGGFLEALAPGYVFIDNRHGVRLQLEGDEALDTYRLLLTLDEFTYERVPVAARGERLVLVRSRAWFTDGAAGPSEVASLSLVECGDDGLIVSDTGFDPDDLDAAHAALEARHTELIEDGSDETIMSPAIVPPNTASRALDRYRMALTARDFDALRECFAGDAVWEDLRRLTGKVLVGRDAIVDSLSLTRELESLRFEMHVIATRRDRLALVRDSIFMVDSLGGEAVVEALNVLAVDESERVVLLRAFDPEDRVAAFADLEQRWLEGDGAPYAAVLEAARCVGAAFHDEETDRFAASLADDLVVVDHRILGWGELDKAMYAEAIGFSMDLGGRVEQLTVDAIASHGQCTTCRGFGVADSGAEYETVFCCVTTFYDGAIARMEYFDVGERDAAIARLHELGRAGAS